MLKIIGESYPILGLYLLLLNSATFFLYGWDKRCAVRQAWRVPEKSLLLVAFLGGGLGAWLGMLYFHHKTKHWQFKFGVPLMLLAHLWLGQRLWDYLR